MSLLEVLLGLSLIGTVIGVSTSLYIGVITSREKTIAISEVNDSVIALQDYLNYRMSEGEIVSPTVGTQSSILEITDGGVLYTYQVVGGQLQESSTLGTVVLSPATVSVQGFSVDHLGGPGIASLEFNLEYAPGTALSSIQYQQTYVTSLR